MQAKPLASKAVDRTSNSDSNINNNSNNNSNINNKSKLCRNILEMGM